MQEFGDFMITTIDLGVAPFDFLYEFPEERKYWRSGCEASELKQSLNIPQIGIVAYDSFEAALRDSNEAIIAGAWRRNTDPFEVTREELNGIARDFEVGRITVLDINQECLEEWWIS